MDFAAGWNAAIQRFGDLTIAVEDDAQRAALWAIYHQMVKEGVPAEAKAIEPTRHIAIETDDGVARYGI